MASLVTAPLEKQFGQISGLCVDEFGEFVRHVGDHACNSFWGARLTKPARTCRRPSMRRADCCPRTCRIRRHSTRSIPRIRQSSRSAITSDNLPLEKVNDFADSILAQKLSEVTGVGLVTIQGNQKPAVRVQVNPAALAAQGLSLEDARTAISQANVNAPKGSFDGKQQAFTLGSNDQILKAEDFKPIILAYRNGGPVRLQDVADVEDGVENSRLAAWIATPSKAISLPCCSIFNDSLEQTSSRRSSA